MPRYFFHVHDGADAGRDTDGIEIDDIAIAKCEAVKYAGKLICDEAGDFWDRKEWKMTVENESGLMLFELQFVGSEVSLANASQSAAPPPYAH